MLTKANVLKICLLQFLLFEIVLSSESINITDYARHQKKPKPNIIIIIADDLGFNDVSFHGSYQIPTPNIDALAYSGIILNNYYVSPICTPSRAALFSGKHPIHTGMQNNVIYGTTPYGLPLSEKILPEYLKEFGYSNHLVGKWHLGHFRRSYTPTCRGFDSHYGHWTGHKDYYDNTAQEANPQAWGYDMRRNMEVSYENFGNYTTDLYTHEATRIIKEHDKSKPLFLTISHTAVHSANPYAFLQAPAETVQKFSYIKNIERRQYAAMVSKMDDSIGSVVESLADANLLSNSIIIFTTDNGGPAAGFNNNAASNWPLRGVKNTLWEGGVRAAGLIWSPLLNKPSISTQMIHVEDWLPTLIGAIGEDPSALNPIDGINLWPALSEGFESPRIEILHNIDDIYGNEAVRHGSWKLLHGTTYGGKWDFWYGPSGHNDSMDNLTSSSTQFLSFQEIISSKAGLAIQKIISQPFRNEDDLMSLQESARIYCNETEQVNNNVSSCSLVSGEYCLFNVIEDPCEYNNLATSKPEIVEFMKQLLKEYRSTAVPPRNQPKDPRGQPKFWDYTWTNWMDFIEPDSNNQSNC